MQLGQRRRMKGHLPVFLFSIFANTQKLRGEGRVVPLILRCDFQPTRCFRVSVVRVIHFFRIVFSDMRNEKRKFDDCV